MSHQEGRTYPHNNQVPLLPYSTTTMTIAALGTGAVIAGHLNGGLTRDCLSWCWMAQRVIVKKEKKAASVKEQVNSLRRLLRIPPTTLAEEVPGAPGSEGGHQPKSDSQTKVIRPPAQEQAQGIDTADGGMYL